MTATIGRIVHYKLSDLDVEGIDTDPSGERNPVDAGEIYPAVIVRVFDTPEGPHCNLQVLLDGDFQYWATSRTEGDEPGQWFWPPRV